MCRERDSETKELAARIGERGDFVAVKTADIGRAIGNGRGVTSDDVTETLAALCEIADLVIEAERANVGDSEPTDADSDIDEGFAAGD
jgi:hypothetical protein